MIKPLEKVVQKTKTQVEIKFTAGEAFMHKLEAVKKPGVSLEETFAAALDALAEKERAKHIPKRNSPVPAHGASRDIFSNSIMKLHLRKGAGGTLRIFVIFVSLTIFLPRFGNLEKKKWLRTWLRPPKSLRLHNRYTRYEVGHERGFQSERIETMIKDFRKDKRNRSGDPRI